MSKKEMREFAKDMLMEAIAVAYYRLEDEKLPEEEENESQHISISMVSPWQPQLEDIIIPCN